VTTPAWDVFISYASEDEAYAQRLAQALTSRGMSVWLFSNVVLLGEKLVSKIDDGIRRSRHSILVLSPEYLTKVYTKAEFDAIIKRAVDNRGGSIIPLLHRGLSQTDLSSFSAFVSELRNMSTAEPFENVVEEILRAVAPPAVTVATPAATQPVAVRSDRAEPGKPLDALQDDVRLYAFRPRLHFGNTAFRQDKLGHTAMTYEIQNIGQGSANKIRAFMPGLWVDSPSEPIPAGRSLPRSVMLCEREAYTEIMPIYAQVIVEFEDHAGNVYRQYGKVWQPRTQGDDGFLYEVPPLERPYLVPQRIVQEDSTGHRFAR
jgi:hypothetical protein